VSVLILNTMKTIWQGWKRFAHRLIAAQSWALMALTYWVAVSPVAVMMKLTKQELTDRSLGDPDSETYWLEPLLGYQDIRRAQRPW